MDLNYSADEKKKLFFKLLCKSLKPITNSFIDSSYGNLLLFYLKILLEIAVTVVQTGQ